MTCLSRVKRQRAFVVIAMAICVQLAAVGCAHNVPSARPASRVLSVVPLDAAAGAPLRVGQQIRARLQMSGPMYIYLGRTSRSGETEILYQSQGLQVPGKDGTVDLPAAGESLVLRTRMRSQPLDQYCFRTCMREPHDFTNLCRRPELAFLWVMRMAEDEPSSEEDVEKKAPREGDRRDSGGGSRSSEGEPPRPGPSDKGPDDCTKPLFLDVLR